MGHAVKLAGLVACNACNPHLGDFKTASSSMQLTQQSKGKPEIVFTKCSFLKYLIIEQNISLSSDSDVFSLWNSSVCVKSTM